MWKRKKIQEMLLKVTKPCSFPQLPAIVLDNYLKIVIRSLLVEEALDPIHRDHKLIGNWQGRRECHIESDWLLVYKFESDRIIFERTALATNAFVFVCIWVTSVTAYAHCQIPCGIYDDYARIQSMLEDAATVKKSIRLIIELTNKNDPQSQNQRVRWIMNKENHAQNIIETICDYFLTQRVKPEQKDYTERLVKHHAVIISAMKTKQNVEEKYVDQLVNRIEALIPYYPKK